MGLSQEANEGTPGPFQIVGIDCAAQAKKVGLAYSKGRSVEGVVAGVPDPAEQILDWVDWDLPVLLAMDAPLGWPKPMAIELSQHRPGVAIQTAPNDFFRRRTDRVVHAALRRPTLDVGADKIARAAHGALQLLNDVRSRSGQSLPILWDIPHGSESGVIEVYPAGTLKSHGYPYQGYKSNKPEQAALRRVIVGHVAKVLTLPETSIMSENADALDAVVCVISGLDFLSGLCIEPGDDLEVAKTEGWIWLKDPHPAGGAA